MNLEKNKYLIQKIFFGFIILLEIVFQYQGLRIEYDIQNFDKIKNFYTYDIFFNNEFKQSTLLYTIIPFDLSNDYIGFLIHFFFTRSVNISSDAFFGFLRKVARSVTNFF